LEDTDFDTAVRVKNQRATILRGLGRYEEASRLLQEVVHMKDSLSGAEIRNQLNEMNTLFKVDELKMEQERTQFRNTLIIIGIIVLALVIFTIFRIRAARRLKKAHDELLVAYDQLEETTTAKERIESDLRIARNIQMGMVPSTFPVRPDLDLYASMKPAKEVGGDLYGYYLIEGNAEQGTSDRLYFCLGDVSGKGVPASLFMAQATRLFRTLAAQEMMPAEIATRMNDALSGEDNETGMFVTMFLGLVDLQTGHLYFSNAGHNPPVLLHDGKADFIDMEPNAPIGLWPGLEYVGEEIESIMECPLFVYTDGLNEAENRQQEQFTDERLLDILQQTPFESSQQTIEMLKDEVEKHRDGAEPNDDLTMLCVKVTKENANNNNPE
jgi:serine phosphatase RsbU (regulator of sigma subunit)